MRKTKKSPTIEETILDNLSPNDLIEMVRQGFVAESDGSEENDFQIWDKVQILNDGKNRVFTVYSYTIYRWGRKEYTVWSEGEYLQYEPWQLVRHISRNPIWFKPK